MTERPAARRRSNTATVMVVATPRPRQAGSGTVRTRNVSSPLCR
jgi:hypothetical protein